jgi:hypothetical protein
MKKVIIFILLCLFFSCNYHNLSKKSDGNCLACYAYLDKNCPAILKHDTLKSIVTVTVLGQVLTTSSNMISPCDSILKYQKQKYIGSDTEIVIENVKKNGLKQLVEVNKVTGQLKAECKSDTLYVPQTIYLPYAHITTKEEVYSWIRMKIYGYWHKYRWWLILILVLTGIVIYKRLTQ